MKDVDLQRRIDSLLKDGWSYGKLARELKVSKTTIARWHKGETKPQLFEHYQAINSLYFGLYQAKEDLVNKPIETTKFKSWDEFEKEFFTDEYYNNAIAYHQKVIDDLKKSRDAQKWKFTEDEKVILRNLPKEYNWLVKSENDSLFVFTSEPQKIDYYWETINKGKDSYCEEISMFNHLFKCIQWSDERPCEFRKYI